MLRLCLPFLRKQRWHSAGFMALLVAAVAAAGAVPGSAAGPRLTAPRDGAVTHLTLPFFSWEDAAPYPFPGEYQVQIAIDRDFAQPVVDDRIPALTGYFVPPRELPPDQYHWRVRYVAAGVDRATVPWSPPRGFRIRAPEPDCVVWVRSGASWEHITSAYQRALQQAARQPADRPGVELRFEPGLYRLRQPAGSLALFETPAGLGQVVINGQGATLVLQACADGPCGFFRADGDESKAVQIRNLVVDYDATSLNTIAGTVETIARARGSFAVRLLPAYAALLDQFRDETEGFFLRRGTFQRILEATSAKARQGWVGGREQATGLLHFDLGAAHLAEVEPGDYWVSVRYGGGDLFTVADGARDVVASNNVFRAARNRIGDIGTQARFIGNSFLRPEGRVLCVPKGGFGTVRTKFTWLENNVIQGTRDDMYHLLHGYGVIRNNRLEAACRNTIHVHGERVWVEGNHILYAGAGGIQIGGKAIVTKQLGDDEMRLTSTEYRGMHGLIVRRNTVIHPREQGIHTRRSDAEVFSPVRFKGIVEPQYEGYQYTDLTIEDNTIIDVGRYQGIYVHGKDLVLRGNTISRRERRRFGSDSEPAWEIGIHVDRCQEAVVVDNRVDDRRLAADRRIVVRQSPRTTVDGRATTDDPARVIDYLHLPTAQLLSWLKLDESEGTTAKEEITGRLLQVRQGTWQPGDGVAGVSLAHQAYVPASGTWRPRIGRGGALRFDGRGTCLAIDGRAPTPVAADQLALSVFFSTDESVIRGRQVLLEARGDPTGGGVLRLIRAGRRLAAEADDGRTLASYPFYYDRYWQHAAVVFDRGRLQLYLNGYRVAEAEGVSRTLPPIRLVGIGAGYGPSGERENFFKGMLDDVRVYRSALPPGAVPITP
ncbi:MAG: hypothetical protein FJ399_01070 [Verrucomicrobia bacterium]|nr:hypothetical protein [Verrucomicrobiota bacterium]